MINLNPLSPLILASHGLLSHCAQLTYQRYKKTAASATVLFTPQFLVGIIISKRVI